MLNLQLKQAETAFANGQLDEAFLLVRSKSARTTRQAQQLAARLVGALVSRGNDHLVGGRLSAAAADAAKAVELGGQQPEVVELFEAVRSAKSVRGKQQQHDHELVRQARRQIDRGAATVGRRILDLANADQTDVQRLAGQLSVQQELGDAALRRARAAIDEGHHEKGLDVLIDLLRSQPDHPDALKEVSRVIGPVASQLREELRAGRLDRALPWQGRLELIADESAEARELVDIMQRCLRASHFMDRSLLDDAEREMGLLAQMMEQADWIVQVRESLQSAISAISQLRRGPLGLIHAGLVEPSQRPVVATTVYRPVLEEKGYDSPLPKSLLLQVDGMGSALLLRSDEVRIGSASRSESIDIPLMSDGIDAPVQIRRQGDDYLLVCQQPIEVNGQMTDRRLLAGGDVLSVGRRGRIRFRKPIAASATALLDLTGATMQRTDIRRIVLFADSLIVGADPGSHLAVSGVPSRYVLYSSADQLAVRPIANPSDQVAAQQPASIPVRLGQPVVLDDVCLTVTHYDSSAPSIRRSRS